MIEHTSTDQPSPDEANANDAATDQATAVAAPSDPSKVLLQALREQPYPVTAKSLKASHALKGTKNLSTDKIEQILEQEAAAGRIYKFCPYRGKGNRYWDRDHKAHARLVIEQTLTGKPRTKSDVERTVQKNLEDCSEDVREEVLNDLIAKGVVEHMPKVWGKGKYLVVPPVEPDSFLPAQIEELPKRLEKNREAIESLGVTPEEVLKAAQKKIAGFLSESGAEEPGAPQQSERDETILQRIVELETAPRDDGYVSLPELRQSLDFHFTTKESFDRAVVSLAQQGKISLQRVEDGESLSEEERQVLVADESGDLYRGVAAPQDGSPSLPGTPPLAESQPQSNSQPEAQMKTGAPSDGKPQAGGETATEDESFSQADPSAPPISESNV